ncbi:MAG: prepilin peptidase, partial [Planctomycetes bacterium]|nr:prepilin peptidase [Planctomycetota bacterium]
FVFALGCCIGSFLNVVIYRLPREKSLVYPGSACPACGKPIRFYDNIPVLSWLALGAKCRQCKAPVSARYFVIELLTGCLFAGVFLAYFQVGTIRDMPNLLTAGWVLYLVHMILISALIASSAIDLELWIIPLTLCWFVTGTSVVGNVAVAGALPSTDPLPSLLPLASSATGALAVGGVMGLVLSLVLLASGKIKRSYEPDPGAEPQKNSEPESGPFDDDDAYDHRKEMCYEVLFLAPVIVLAYGAYWVTHSVPSVTDWWAAMLAKPVVTALLGSLWGYFVGCGVVWATRVFGTLGFGKEAMGLGDVHLMGAVGAVIGAKMVTVAFFIAPFFGLTWALFHMFFKKTRQIPYGPFLSLGSFTVMIFHDWVVQRLFMLYGG